MTSICAAPTSAKTFDASKIPAKSRTIREECICDGPRSPTDSSRFHSVLADRILHFEHTGGRRRLSLVQVVGGRHGPRGGSPQQAPLEVTWRFAQTQATQSQCAEQRAELRHLSGTCLAPPARSRFARWEVPAV